MLIRRFTTQAEDGTYPTTPIALGGDGGGGGGDGGGGGGSCVADDTLILMANDQHNSSGGEKLARDVAIGDCVWTRPETTLA